MRLGHWSVVVFLISFSMSCCAAHKPKQVRNGHHNRPPAPPSLLTQSQMPRSQSAVDCTAHDASQYIAINSTVNSPRNSPQAHNHRVIPMPPPNDAEKHKPKKNWWQRNRVNVAVGLSAISPIMLGMTCWFMKSAVNGAVAQVQTEFAPVAQAAGEINALYTLIQNITATGKP